ncbi:hypothetical protein HDV05_002766, partial [Chytridiales sp. JEL 0842]
MLTTAPATTSRPQPPTPVTSASASSASSSRTMSAKKLAPKPSTSMAPAPPSVPAKSGGMSSFFRRGSIKAAKAPNTTAPTTTTVTTTSETPSAMTRPSSTTQKDRTTTTTNVQSTISSPKDQTKTASSSPKTPSSTKTQPVIKDAKAPWRFGTKTASSSTTTRPLTSNGLQQMPRSQSESRLSSAPPASKQSATSSDKTSIPNKSTNGMKKSASASLASPSKPASTLSKIPTKSSTTTRRSTPPPRTSSLPSNIAGIESTDNSSVLPTGVQPSPVELPHEVILQTESEPGRTTFKTPVVETKNQVEQEIETKLSGEENHLVQESTIPKIEQEVPFNEGSFQESPALADDDIALVLESTNNNLGNAPSPQEPSVDPVVSAPPAPSTTGPIANPEHAMDPNDPDIIIPILPESTEVTTKDDSISQSEVKGSNPFPTIITPFETYPISTHPAGLPSEVVEMVGFVDAPHVGPLPLVFGTKEVVKKPDPPQNKGFFSRLRPNTRNIKGRKGKK